MRWCIRASYTFQIPGTNLSLIASYLKSDSDVASLGGTDVVGKGQIAGIRLVVPLKELDGFTHSLVAGADYKNFTQALSLSGQGNSVPLTYYPVTIGYNASWTAPRSRTDLTAAAVMGSPEFGSATAEVQANRAFASGSFVYFRGSIMHTHELPLGMQLWARVQGQASGDALVPNEQFAAGGLDTVRGYLEAEVLGDDAAGFQIELRSPSFAEAISPKVNEIRFHLFADSAITSINQPLPGQRRNYGLSSIGFGIRARFADHVSAAFRKRRDLKRRTDDEARLRRAVVPYPRRFLTRHAACSPVRFDSAVKLHGGGGGRRSRGGTGTGARG